MRFCAPLREPGPASASANMDFREILLIASKGQGVNNVPVGTSGDATVGNAKLLSFQELELPTLASGCSSGEERPGPSPPYCAWACTCWVSGLAGVRGTVMPGSG